MVAVLAIPMKAEDSGASIQKFSEKYSVVYDRVTQELNKLSTLYKDDQELTPHMVETLLVRAGDVRAQLQAYPPLRGRGVENYFYEWSMQHLNTSMAELKVYRKSLTETSLPRKMGDLHILKGFSSAWTMESWRETFELVKKHGIIGEVTELNKELINKKYSEKHIKDHSTEHINKRSSAAEVKETISEVQPKRSSESERKIKKKILEDRTPNSAPLYDHIWLQIGVLFVIGMLVLWLVKVHTLGLTLTLGLTFPLPLPLPLIFAVSCEGSAEWQSATLCVWASCFVCIWGTLITTILHHCECGGLNPCARG